MDLQEALVLRFGLVHIGKVLQTLRLVSLGILCLSFTLVASMPLGAVPTLSSPDRHSSPRSIVNIAELLHATWTVAINAILRQTSGV